MLQNAVISLAQVPVVTGHVSPEEASLIFSGPKFIVALLAGVLMAFAFQLLLTNLSVAVGISTGADVGDDSADTLGGKISAVEAKVGLWALVTSSIALFCACFLAVKLSLIESLLLGSIIGVVIWSTYFSLIMWLGSNAVGSLIGSVVSTANSGFKGLMGTATAAIGANVSKNQMVSTAEEITAAVRRELTAGIDPESISKTLQSSLSSLDLPKLDVKDIRNQFNNLLSDVDWQSLGDSDLLKNVNRQTFVDLISNRTDFSRADINRIADELEGAWNQVTNRQNSTEQVINILKSAAPDELNSEQLGARIQQLVAVGGGNGNGGNGILKQVIQSGIGSAAPALLERVDLSKIDVDKITQQLQSLTEKAPDVDVDKITQQLKQLREKASERVTEVIPAFDFNTIKSDVDEYILNSLPWHFNRATIKNEFRDVIYDPNANPTTVIKELDELNLEYFANLLSQRGDFSTARVKEISQQLEDVRQEVLGVVRKAQAREQSQNLRSRIEDYLRSRSKDELNSQAIESDLTQLLEDPEAGVEELTQRFAELDRNDLVKLLQQRDDINAEEANNIIAQLESTRDRVLNRARELQEQALATANELRQRVEDYLRNTNQDELNPDAIARDFRTLLDDPEAGIYALRARLSQFDRDTLVKLLSQRDDLSEEQVNQVLDQLESVRDSILQAPQQLAESAKQQYEQTINAISEYLRSTNREELNPEGIQRDLAKLFDDPKEGALALRERVSHIDRDTLVQLLTQRGDLSEEQVNQIIDSLQAAVNNIIKAPRRFTTRVVKPVVDFETTLESYLRNTNKEELNPEGIKRDLQLLLSSPSLGVNSLAERAGKFDRSTLVALLSQREDISEEEANRIVEQIESVRTSIVEQFQQIQHRMQSILDGIFGRIRNYLNSLNRTELNYEGIQQDFAKLFDDPQVGFDALRSRLSQFDRDTLVAVLSSREDISEEQANQILNRVEAARDSVLHRAERIQQETQRRLQAIKEEAKKQAVDTKKAVADAAWWLFNTAFASLAASAAAGALAVASTGWFG